LAERIYTEGWKDGGYIRKDAQGRDTYVIYRQIAGKRYEVSTRAHTLRAALEQLKRFEADPEGYDPRGNVRPDAIYLDEKLSEEFLTYSRREKENTGKWVREQQRSLAWWAEKLHGVDLRGASLRDQIVPVVKQARGNRVAVLKALYSWLRKTHKITFAEDPTAGGMLEGRQPTKRRGRGPKAVPREHVELALAHLTGNWRDALLLQSETGWHVTEVQRFAQGGEVEPASASQKAQGIAGVLIVEHKGGEQHRSAVSSKVLEAAERLREREGFSVEWYARALKKACPAAGIKKPFGAGQMRHSVATWAVESGADIAAVSTFLGHKSPRTTKKFYATHATPKNPMIALPLLSAVKAPKDEGGHTAN
jgi:integrase